MVNNTWLYNVNNGCAGKGHAKFLALSGENSRTLLYKHHCPSNESPGVWIIEGSPSFDGVQGRVFKSLILLSRSSLEFFTKIYPGWLLLK